MKTIPKTDEEINQAMGKVMKEGFFNQAQNFLGTDTMKKHGLTKENLNIKTILEIAKKEKFK